ncbi:uncharacterized protein LOC132749732 [Ruditapes philippinarum]|uniref:uncharacterized protein LOC132749732 n=1 Tax=Ruditapes philippinarum TaxID=129788 RepID=UPI00295AF2F4|nr:uncharacterized protein LOC132749732 [Ruditapes philippinarum]
MEGARITDIIIEDSGEVTYEVVESGSNRGCKKLVSSDGFSFCVKSRKDQESRRNKNMTCKATVSQRDELFIAGKFEHCHPADSSLTKKVKLRKNVKQAGKENIFTSATKVVDLELPRTFSGQDFNLVNTTSFARVVNRTRAKIQISSSGTYM